MRAAVGNAGGGHGLIQADKEKFTESVFEAESQLVPDALSMLCW